MVKFILIKSPDEWATTKQTCTDELVVYLSFSSHNKSQGQQCYTLMGFFNPV